MRAAHGAHERQRGRGLQVAGACRPADPQQLPTPLPPLHLQAVETSTASLPDAHGPQHTHKRTHTAAAAAPSRLRAPCRLSPGFCRCNRPHSTTFKWQLNGGSSYSIPDRGIELHQCNHRDGTCRCNCPRSPTPPPPARTVRPSSRSTPLPPPRLPPTQGRRKRVPGPERGAESGSLGPPPARAGDHPRRRR